MAVSFSAFSGLKSLFYEPPLMMGVRPSKQDAVGVSLLIRRQLICPMFRHAACHYGALVLHDDNVSDRVNLQKATGRLRELNTEQECHRFQATVIVGLEENPELFYHSFLEPHPWVAFLARLSSGACGHLEVHWHSRFFLCLLGTGRTLYEHNKYRGGGWDGPLVRPVLFFWGGSC